MSVSQSSSSSEDQSTLASLRQISSMLSTTVHFNNVLDCGTGQSVAHRPAAANKQWLLSVVLVYSLFLKSNIFHIFELHEHYFILVKVHKVQAKNKVHKIRTSQLWYGSSQSNCTRGPHWAQWIIKIQHKQKTSRIGAEMKNISVTTYNIVVKLSSTRIISAASFDTSVPVLPIAMPMSELRRATASLTPSPVMPTICPVFCNACTQWYTHHFLCNGFLAQLAELIV